MTILPNTDVVESSEATVAPEIDATSPPVSSEQAFAEAQEARIAELEAELAEQQGAAVEVIEAAPERSESLEEIARKARENTVACRLKRGSFTVNRKFTGDQVAKVADSFNAKSEVVSANKKLIDSKHPKVKAVTVVLAKAYRLWKNVFTTPYPDAGIRLLKRDRMEEFESDMRECQAELEVAKTELDEAYAEVIAKAEVDLQDLFNRSEYPASLSAAYSIEWEYPSVEPPNWMKEVHPEAYAAQVRIINARFEDAVTQTETLFAEEFAKVVEHLAERLGKDEETGEFHSIQTSNIDNVKKFIEKFREMNFGGNTSMAELIDQAEKLIDGKTTKSLKKNNEERLSMQESFEKLRDEMDGKIVAVTREISLESDE